MAGRKPKPTALKKLHGNPGKRPLNNNEPKFAGRPDLKTIPWLNTSAKTEWKRIMREMGDLDYIKSTDQVAFASYCTWYAKWRDLEIILEQEGQIVKEPQYGTTKKDGNIEITYLYDLVKPHPAARLAESASQQVRHWAAVLGFDPANRSKVSVPSNNPEGGSDAGEEFD